MESKEVVRWIEKFTTRWQMWFILAITATILILSAVSLCFGIEPPWALTILLYVIVAVLSQVLKDYSQEERTKTLVNIAKMSLREELKRNYCTADLHKESILGTTAWTAVTSSGIVLSFSNKELKTIIESYSAIGFYNIDMVGVGWTSAKRVRVMKAIFDALRVLGASDIDELDCDKILEKFVGTGAEPSTDRSSPKTNKV